MKFSVVIPCYNEEKGILNVINNLPKTDSEIIVVDNNSTDNTAAIAPVKRLKNSKVLACTHPCYDYTL